MIYKKSEIDKSLVTCPYEEQEDYIYIEDEYTNNVLRLAGYSDISRRDFIDLCFDKILVDKLLPYALKSPEYGYLYARNTLKGRFELGEQAIATEPVFSYYYARDILKGRFEIAEPVIATYPKHSYWYARDVLGGRFELGEPVIATNKNYKKQYEERFGVKL